MHIAGTPIGPASPPYVIAEVGVNHDGSREQALALVRAAKEAGADAVKFQYFEARRLMSGASSLATYQAQAGERDPVEMLSRLEMSIEDLVACTALARELGLHSIVTVFNVELVRAAETVGFDAYKTASPDIIHRPLLLALEATGRPLVLSTGAATADEVRRALSWLSETTRERTAILQCVSSYPTPLEKSAIGAMRALSRLHAGPIGYSDHTPDVETGAIAVAAGASVLEKHLTLDRKAQGPDHAASLEPSMLRRYVALAHAAWASTRAPGNDDKRVSDIEKEVRHLSRQSIVVRRKEGLRAGNTVEPSDITIKRPGTGLEPALLNAVVGRPVLRDVGFDTPLTEADIDILQPAAMKTAAHRTVRRICFVTGSRAEFGLLRPVIDAVSGRESLSRQVVVAGSHLLGDKPTAAEVESAFHVDAGVAMQSSPDAIGLGDTRQRDAASVGAGIVGFTRAFRDLAPDVIVVLGDRIEAFAAAAAGAIGGQLVAHIHGGDRAEGIADESMRHGISKLAHIHFAASERSAARLIAMGEDDWRVFNVGSPAIDGLSRVRPLSDASLLNEPGRATSAAHAAQALPRCVVLLHPSGFSPQHEETMAAHLFEQVEALAAAMRLTPVLALLPNHDAGREAIVPLLRSRAADGWLVREHLPRAVFLSLLKHLAMNGGVLIGNSSAGLIEAAALGVPVVNVGPRQNGRERGGNIADLGEHEIDRLAERVREVLARPIEQRSRHPYGDGDAAARIVSVLESIDADNPRWLRKRNAY